MFEFIKKYFNRQHIIKVNKICDMPNQEMLQYTDWAQDNIMPVYTFNMYYKFFENNTLYIYKSNNKYIVQCYHRLYEWVQFEFSDDITDFSIKINTYKRVWHDSLYMRNTTGFYKLAEKIIKCYK